MKLTLSTINHDQRGFGELVQLWQKLEYCSFEEIIIDMGSVNWFDADMCATFGAILQRLNENMNTVKLINIPKRIENVLSKNGFLSHHGGEKIPDFFGTTIPYKRFNANDDRYFAEYIENELLQRHEIPVMSMALMKKFSESIFEIFSNAVLHSQTKLGIFSCGQFFPKRHRLDFSISDLGVGMRQNIKDKMGFDFSPEDAIKWANEGRNTTKRGPVPGGLGLKILREFIDMNGGYIQIVSDSGYWRRESGKTSTASLLHPFPGTIVSIEINTNDSNSYRLSSEDDDFDIF